MLSLPGGEAQFGKCQMSGARACATLHRMAASGNASPIQARLARAAAGHAGMMRRGSAEAVLSMRAAPCLRRTAMTAAGADLAAVRFDHQGAAMAHGIRSGRNNPRCTGCS
jgi:hypothetical protein